MKKRVFYSCALVAALMLGACSSNDDLNGGTAGNASDKSYLAINIKNVGSVPGSRAASDYEDGTKEETHIDGVRFYFFNADGSPYMLRENGESTGKNWLDKGAEFDSDDKSNPNVEMISKAVLVIEGNKGTSPATMVAVINPATLKDDGGDGLDDKVYTLDQLKTDAAFAHYFHTHDQDGKCVNFVMSNSAYVDKGASKCSSIVTGHVATDATSAKANPVDIYVERVVAKVRTNFSDKDKTKDPERPWVDDVETGKKAMKIGTYSTFDIYAVVDGWGLADEDGKAQVIKQVNTNWTDDALGIDTWTSPDYHRCFWSASVPFTAGTGTNGNTPVNHSWNFFANRALGTSTYTLPNTTDKVFPDPYASYLTKMVVAAHLVYKKAGDTNYSPAEICQYRGQQYISVDDVKKDIANENAKYWIVTTGKDGQEQRTKLAPENIDFTAESSDADPLKDYEVRPILKLNDGEKIQEQEEAGGNTTWKDVTVDDVNKLLGTNPAQIRKDGKTYYYIPIRHLGTDPTKVGYYGIVRNHIYDISINNIKGFGTPVYDPAKVIDPTLPSDKDTYLAARINVLSWRIVHQDADLDKTGTK